ncbi:MAG: YfhO family protein, partial [Chlorobi bacterium]|nr:YfhO family protein [Chlorobiota bacterium]
MTLKGFFNKNSVRKALPFLVLLILAILGYWQIAMFRHPLKWDIIDQAFPWKYFIGESLQHHILPLWNPYQHCGYPIHADPQSSVWYPITWFFGYVFGYSIYVLSIDFTLHIFLAGSGMFLLGKKMGFQEKVALIMGVAYMFSGFLVGNAQHFMWIISATWIPFILYAYIDLYQEQKLRQAAVFGLFMFMMVTGGYPAFTMILLYLLILLFVQLSFSIYRNEGRLPLYRFFRVNAYALVFSVTNSMVMLISVWKLMPELTRTGGIPLRDALEGPLSPQSLISFFLPFGVVNHDMSFFGTDLSMSNVYFGLFMFIFFVASLLMKKPPFFKLFLFWGLFILSAAVGSALPVREFLYYYVPFFDIFRFPALLRIFVIISFVVLAGFAINEFLSDREKHLKKLKIATLITGFSLLMIIVVFSFGQYINLGEYLADGNLFSFSKKSSIAQQIFFQGIVQLVLLVLFFILVSKTKGTKRILSFLIVLVVADLIFAAQLNAPFTVYEKKFSQKAIYEARQKQPLGFPLPAMHPVADNNDRTSPHFVSSWRNLNIFHKQIAWDGYNPAQLRNFVFLEDSLKPLFKATIQNPPIYLGSGFYSNELLKDKSILNNVDSSMVFLSNEDLSKINVEAPRSGDNVRFTSFSPNRVQIRTQTSHQSFLVFLQSKY